MGFNNIVELTDLIFMTNIKCMCAVLPRSGRTDGLVVHANCFALKSNLTLIEASHTNSSGMKGSITVVIILLDLVSMQTLELAGARTD